MNEIYSRKTGARVFPVVDLGRCSRCQGCIEIAPEVFRYNEETGSIDVVDLPEYPVDTVNEAMKYCPEDCISWEERG